MYLELDPTGAPALRDPANFRAFKLVLHKGRDTLAAAHAAFAGLATPEGEGHVWVSASALRARPEVAHDADWQSGFDAMVETARPHGWVHPETGAIRAHIEWAEPA